MTRMLTAKSHKILGSVLVVGVLGSVSAAGVFGAFSATTQNAGNEISTGSVAIGDNDAGQAMFNVTNARPNESWTRCLKVTYTGSLESDVRLYSTGSGGGLSQYLRIKLEQGTSAAAAFPSCEGFVPDPTSGQVADSTTPGAIPPLDWSTGAVLSPNGAAPGAPAPFAQTQSVVVRMTMSLDPAMPDALQGATTGVTTVVVEARNR
jgi:hypothetical protein